MGKDRESVGEMRDNLRVAEEQLQKRLMEFEMEMEQHKAQMSREREQLKRDRERIDSENEKLEQAKEGMKFQKYSFDKDVAKLKQTMADHLQLQKLLRTNIQQSYSREYKMRLALENLQAHVVRMQSRDMYKLTMDYDKSQA